MYVHTYNVYAMCENYNETSGHGHGMESNMCYTLYMTFTACNKTI